MSRWSFVFVLLLAPLPVGAQTLTEGACERLGSLTLPGTTITTAAVVASGTFTPAGATPSAAAALSGLPPFCRVAATLTPSADSVIKVEFWLPISTWNGKFLAVGNGSWGGAVSYAGLAVGVKRGYATASTDTGHVGNTAAEMLDHPEKLIDFAYRAVHETAATGKAVTRSLFGSSPRFSYFQGCSTGGRQGLQSAQLFPEDFDGIVAGAPSLDQVRHAAGRMQISHAVLKNDASYIPPAKYPLLHKAAIAACDALDGLADGLIDDPRACQFDPAVLACRGSDAPSCLTAAQVESATTILRPVVAPGEKDVYLPRLQPGSELAWGIQAGRQPYGNSLEVLKYFVFKDPQWNWRTFDFSRHLALLDDTGHLLKATDPNLKPFASRGGKLLMYHGWSDSTIAPETTIDYHRRVLETMGGPAQTSEWVRLFMVPGMHHCIGGDGPDSFDALGTLEAWVERGKAPDRITASHSTNGVVDRTRPLCPFPQVARYTGAGSIDDADNFVCRAP